MDLAPLGCENRARDDKFLSRALTDAQQDPRHSACVHDRSKCRVRRVRRGPRGRSHSWILCGQRQNEWTTIHSDLRNAWRAGDVPNLGWSFALLASTGGWGWPTSWQRLTTRSTKFSLVPRIGFTTGSDRNCKQSAKVRIGRKSSVF